MVVHGVEALDSMQRVRDLEREVIILRQTLAAMPEARRPESGMER
jgi:hypothetical protein